jgi:enoyl-CoA hydratase
LRDHTICRFHFHPKGQTMNFADYPESLKLERHDGILTVTLNNPDQMNAILHAMDVSLPKLFFEADRDPETKIIVLTGAGRAFCAGGDISAMKAGVESMDGFIEGYRNGKRFMQMMLDCEKPIIAKVNGDAIGLGATLALYCDIVVASETARFADPHVKVGLVAGDGGAIVWPSYIGYAAAKYFLLTGDMVSAREAQQMGLIAKVTTPENLDAEVDRLATKLANGAQGAIRYTKTVLNIGLRQQFAASVDAGFALETVSGRMADHREAVTAFVEKRKPQFGRG